ncbi:HvfC/BufC N-terminal domain-containing protein [Yoonia vestfoldensis]|uniref:HvfC/BufC N-terminal domain-containing protein n=1 Tax=Yoonia vestfoldensis TaxID=245188 RepID=UPI0003750831|nr:DNA-binding domain-containing protein [Yoonia vestfoldensis]
MQPDTHAAQQDAFQAALWRQDPPAGLTAPAMDEVAQRFSVYRNNVQHSLTRALASRFPVIEQLVGATFFTAMARVHIAQDPPTSPVLLNWGAGFPAFLDGFAPVGHLPFMGDVARLEYARGLAYHAADAAPVAPDALAVADLETLRLGLHPSVQLFKSPHPALQIWQSHQTGAARHMLTAGPDHALIGRAPDFSIIVAPLDQGTFAVLAALAAGATLESAAKHNDPTAALTLLLRHGLITAIKTGVPT